MPDLVVVDRLVKRYGSRVAVRDVSFAIEEGEVIGLLGPNGSGKSTMMRLLTGYFSPTSGRVRIGGIRQLVVRARSATPAVGARAYPSRTPTLSSTGGDLAELTTRTPPDRGLLQYSIAGSLRTHVPFVVTLTMPGASDVTA